MTSEDSEGRSSQPWAPLEPQPTSPSPALPWQEPQGQTAPWRQAGAASPKVGDARTGPLPLHPMTVSDILDGAFKLLKANWRAALLIAGTFVVPIDIVVAFARRNLNESRGLLEVLNNPSTSSRPNLGAQYEAVAISLVVASLVTFFVGATLSRVVAAPYLGREETAGEALRATGTRVAPLLAGWLLVHALEALTFPLCVFPGLVVMSTFVAVAPAMVLEDLGPIKAMRRSAALMWPRLFPVMAVALLAGIVVYFVVNALGTIPATLALLIGPRSAWPLLALASILGGVIGTPIIAIVATLLYFDGRIRQEGFDLQVMADQLARRSTQ